MGGQLSGRPYSTAPAESIKSMSIKGSYIAYVNDAARRVATFFEKWDCLIETDLRTSRLPKKRLNPYGPFSAVSPLEYGGLKPILPIL